MVYHGEVTHILVRVFTRPLTLSVSPSCHPSVAAHNQERPTAAVTPIQVQNAACLGPASVGLPHHTLASQPLPPMAGPAAHVAAAVSIGRTSAPLACAAGASLASPNMTTAALETEPSARTVTILPGLPTSPESAASACGNSSAGKPDKDSKVRAPPLCYSLMFWGLFGWLVFASERTHCSTAL